MRKLIVMYKEDPGNPAETWSGTSYSLRKALENYVDVIFIDSSDTVFMKLINCIAVKLGKYIPCFFLGTLYSFLNSSRAKRKLRNYKDIPVLEIANEIKIDNPFYLYQDLSYANWIEANKEIIETGIKFDSGNLNCFCALELRRRILWQETLYKQCKKVFYMGNWPTREMKELYPRISYKFVHSGGGLNTQFQFSDRQKQKNRIIFVGIDFERKGGELVLEAFKLLKNLVPDATLVIIGPQKKENICGVKWLGKVSREVISQELSSSMLFCMPSVFEAYGLVFVEALCYGIPVIARDSYEMPYFVQHEVNGYLIKRDDPRLLAELMYKGLNNKAMQERVRRLAKDYQKEYSWDNVAKNIVSEIFDAGRK